jgi:adenosine 3'-phospho 5'-phosphosulfate transporter B2
VGYGILQERIMSEPYGDEMFHLSIFLVFINRVAAVIFAYFMIVAQHEPYSNAAPVWKYCAISISNVAASWCQYEALRYVSFPVQMLGKSFKMMPVMCWGMIISQKRYTVTEWAIACCVTGGVTEFLLTGSIAPSHPHGTSVHGIILLIIFLGLDGFTSTFQEKLFKVHRTTKYNQMLYVNGCSSLISVICLLATQTMGPAWSFAHRHPAMFGDAVVLSITAVGGQWFIYSQVKEAGALVFAATMNVRQVVSILVSYGRFHHHITGLQILGLVIVFLALFYKSCTSLLADKKEVTKSHEKDPLLPETGKKDAEA